MTPSATDRLHHIGRSAKLGDGYSFQARGQSVEVHLTHVNTPLGEVTVTVAGHPVTLGAVGGRGASVKLTGVRGGTAHLVLAARPDVYIARLPRRGQAVRADGPESPSDRRPVAVRRNRTGA
jgi:hypothetical protein